MATDTNRLFNEAVSQHSAGQLDRAEALRRGVSVSGFQRTVRPCKTLGGHVQATMPTHSGFPEHAGLKQARLAIYSKSSEL